MGQSVSSEEMAAAKGKHRKDLLAKHGVLIPPAFAVVAVGQTPPPPPATSTKTTASVVSFLPTLSLLDRIDSMNSPSYIDFVRELDPSERLLRDFVDPGLWISTKASQNTDVRASLAFTSNSNSSSTTGGGGIDQGVRLVVERLFPKKSAYTQIRVGSHGLPAIQSRFLFTPYTAIAAQSDASGTGWVGTFFSIDRSRFHVEEHDSWSNNEPVPLSSQISEDWNVQIGTWLPFCRNNNPLTSKSSSFLQEINVYTAFSIPGITAAMEVAMPLSRLSSTTTSSPSTYTLMDTGIQTRSFLSINLASDDLVGSTKDEAPNGMPLPAPPLQLKLERTADHRSQLSLSQTLTFDRYQFNPFEDRAPKVRNALSWTVQIESTATSKLDKDDVTVYRGPEPASTTPSSQAQVALGAVWQMNRALALKAVVRPQRNEIRTSVLLKRWKHPRVECSLLNQYDWGTNKWTFLGIGVELETLPEPAGSSRHATYYYPPHQEKGVVGSPNEGEVPETKATLPGDLY